MFDPISGEDTGDMIAGTDHTITHDWPSGMSIQGGRSGLVLSRTGDHYKTAFIEAFPIGGGFIRGEGETVLEAETAAWQKYQIFLKCPESGSEHSYKPYRKTANGSTPYYNGAGFCEHCNTFMSQCFTAEDLNAKCQTCGTYSFYSNETKDGERLFGCIEHPVKNELLDKLLGLHDDD